MKIKIMVAAHKNYKMPEDESMYLPVFVGKSLHPNVNHTFQGDNTGNNISNKNSSYNELTALYWGWKNIDADYIGLVHYRRYFSKKRGKKLENILTKKEAEKILSKYDVILPKKRNYYIETNYSHYVHAHPKEELDVTREVLERKYPTYIPFYDEMMKRTSAHLFNMFVMKRELLDEYCTWLFDILADIEQQIDTSDYDKYQSRIFGFISERLLDVWIDKNQVDYYETSVLYTESQHWPKKIFEFIKRKLIH